MVCFLLFQISIPIQLRRACLEIFTLYFCAICAMRPHQLGDARLGFPSDRRYGWINNWQWCLVSEISCLVYKLIQIMCFISEVGLNPGNGSTALNLIPTLTKVDISNFQLSKKRFLIKILYSVFRKEILKRETIFYIQTRDFQKRFSFPHFGMEIFEISSL